MHKILLFMIVIICLVSFCKAAEISNGSGDSNLANYFNENKIKYQNFISKKILITDKIIKILDLPEKELRLYTPILIFSETNKESSTLKMRLNNEIYIEYSLFISQSAAISRLAEIAATSTRGMLQSEMFEKDDIFYMGNLSDFGITFIIKNVLVTMRWDGQSTEKKEDIFIKIMHMLQQSIENNDTTKSKDDTEPCKIRFPKELFSSDSLHDKDRKTFNLFPMTPTLFDFLHHLKTNYPEVKRLENRIKLGDRKAWVFHLKLKESYSFNNAYYFSSDSRIMTIIYMLAVKDPEINDVQESIISKMDDNFLKENEDPHSWINKNGETRFSLHKIKAKTNNAYYIILFCDFNKSSPVNELEIYKHAKDLGMEVF